MLSAVSVAEFVLTEDERDRLIAWSRDGSRVAVRAKIVLACAEPGVSYARLAERLGVTPMTVINVRRRFAASRLDGLADRPRPGRAKARLVLTEDERVEAGAMVAAGEELAGVGIESPDRPGVCGIGVLDGADEQAGRP